MGLEEAGEVYLAKKKHLTLQGEGENMAVEGEKKRLKMWIRLRSVRIERGKSVEDNCYNIMSETENKEGFDV